MYLGVHQMALWYERPGDVHSWVSYLSRARETQLPPQPLASPPASAFVITQAYEHSHPCLFSTWFWAVPDLNLTLKMTIRSLKQYKASNTACNLCCCISLVRILLMVCVLLTGDVHRWQMPAVYLSIPVPLTAISCFSYSSPRTLPF